MRPTDRIQARVATGPPAIVMVAPPEIPRYLPEPLQQRRKQQECNQYQDDYHQDVNQTVHVHVSAPSSYTPLTSVPPVS
jgi:hypothetical protein